MNTIQTIAEQLALSVHAPRMKELYYEVLPLLQQRYGELIAEAAYARQHGRFETEGVFKREAKAWGMAIDSVQDVLMAVSPQVKQPAKLQVVPK